MSIKKFFIIDAMAMIFRNYHAFGANPLSNSNGLPTSAIFGSAKFLLKLIEDEKPDYLAIASDSQTKNFRHSLYEAYKANRSQMPEDLAVQIPYVYRLFDALGCPVIKCDHLEADDLIGSLAIQFKSQRLHCYIVSGDKDFLQLVDDRVSLYSPKKGGIVEILDAKGVQEKFGCNPAEVVDLLALIGDSSDNVPGVKGIGEKGAVTLIRKYGSLDGVYQHIQEITNKRQQKGLIENRDMAYLSKELVTIKVDAELPYSLEMMACNPKGVLGKKELITFFEEMEFRSLAEQVRRNLANFSADPSNGSTKPLPDAAGRASVVRLKPDEDKYRLINTKAKLSQLVNALEKISEYSLDTETTGLNIVTDRAIGISVAWQEGYAYYIPLIEQHLEDISPEEIIATMRSMLENNQALIIGHNLKFDLQMLRNIGIVIQGKLADTMIMSHLVESNLRAYSLDSCCLRYLDYQKIPTTALIGLDASQSMTDVDIERLVEYACEDADLTFRLYKHLEPKIKEKELSMVFHAVEMPLVPILAAMEQQGIYLDTDKIEQLSKHLDTEVKILEKQIYVLADETFNINSPKQLQVILFDKLKIPQQLNINRILKTKSGLSTNFSVLEQLSEHELPQKILQYRTMTKLKNTYVDTLPQIINSKTSRIHTCFHQTGTATGRLSSSGPNLQNIPIRSDLGKEIRKAFRAQKNDDIIFSADYSQVELRLLAHLADETNLIMAFQAGEDIHRATASRILDIPLEMVSPSQRSQAKAINFGIIYGMGPQRLAKTTNVSLQEAKAFIDRYFATYPRIKSYMESSIAFARKYEQTRTIMGRLRPLPEVNSNNKMAMISAQNVAINSPVQGSAADLIKLAMIKIEKRLRESNLHAKMLLQVHDELVFECPENEYEESRKLVKECMESAMTLRVPLVVDIGYGVSWFDAH